VEYLLVDMPSGNAGLSGERLQAIRGWSTWVPVAVGRASQGALAGPTETPQVRDTAVDPHWNPTDERHTPLHLLCAEEITGFKSSMAHKEFLVHTGSLALRLTLGVVKVPIVAARASCLPAHPTSVSPHR
jgi:hypothetical protein